jgi:hypothetical protein
MNAEWESAEEKVVGSRCKVQFEWAHLCRARSGGLAGMHWQDGPE